MKNTRTWAGKPLDGMTADEMIRVIETMRTFLLWKIDILRGEQPNEFSCRLFAAIPRSL